MRFFKLNDAQGNADRNLKLFFIMAVGLVVFVGIVALAVFFVVLRGEEQTLVPEVRGKELTQALLELQVKELYPRIHLRYSQSSRERGIILEQEPLPGTIVKAGRRIRLVVSQGVVLNRVENYIGRNIDEVRMDLLTMGAALESPLLTLREPYTYDYSPAPPGTILQQRPEAGTNISGPINLEVVVSRGPENILVTVPQIAGLELSPALELIGRTGIGFEFSLRNTHEGEQGGMVVSQNPPAGTSITANTMVSLVVNTPAVLGEHEVFNLFSYTIPRNPFPLPVYLDAVLPSEEQVRLISVEYLGGNFTIPYRLPIGSTLILSMMGREIHRETARN